MVRITRVYTRTGDRGDTRLAGGKKVRKDSLRVSAYGTVDELMSALGVARSVAAESKPRAASRRVDALLARIQNELFNLGASLATPHRQMRPETPRLHAHHVTRLERDVDAFNEKLPELRSFVLPGGGPLAAHLHLARTVCRRAEREVVRMGRTHSLPPEAVRYLNRLSDLLFVLARWSAKASGHAEPLWEPDRA